MPNIDFVYCYFPKKKSMITFCLKKCISGGRCFFLFLRAKKKGNGCLSISEYFDFWQFQMQKLQKIVNWETLHIQTLHRSEIGPLIWFKITKHRIWSNLKYNITRFPNPMKMKCPFTSIDKECPRSSKKNIKNKPKIIENQQCRSGKNNSWTCGMRVESYGEATSRLSDNNQATGCHRHRSSAVNLDKTCPMPWKANQTSSFFRSCSLDRFSLQMLFVLCISCHFAISTKIPGYIDIYIYI